MTTKCKYCKKTKALSEYYPGSRKMCKQCAKDRSTQRRRDNPEHTRLIDKAYYEKNKYKIRLYKARWEKNNPDKVSSYRKKYKYALTRKWEKLNKHKKGVHQKVRRALMAGKILKPNTCQICKQKKTIYGHHHDYTKPLDVVWLCQSCHRILHNNINKLQYDNNK